MCLISVTVTDRSVRVIYVSTLLSKKQQETVVSDSLESTHTP